MTNRIGIYPGTFDPITNGHRDIVRRALRVVDELVIAVALDTAKQPLFSIEDRVALVRADLASLTEDTGRIRIESFSGLLVRFAEEQGASLIVRGLRAVSDFEYEFQMACMNRTLQPELETVFLTASEHTHFVSSRFVKQIARLGGDISPLVSQPVEKALKDYFSA